MPADGEISYHNRQLLDKEIVQNPMSRFAPVFCMKN